MKKVSQFTPLLVGFVLIALSYCNTVFSSWHFDDYSAIVYNAKLHLPDLTFRSLINTFFASPTHDRLYRPIANLTFALNWYFCEDRVAGYHLVNILIHFWTFLFLYLSSLKLLSTPYLPGWYKRNRVFLAGGASLMWALHPIQIQAVTYIVQRMASLAGLFYIIAIFCYLKTKNKPSNGRVKQIFWLAITGVFFWGALSTKENAIMLPLAIIVIEYVFYRDSFVIFLNRYKKLLSLLGILLSIALLFFVKEYFFKTLSGYTIRSFSLQDRLLTESRVLFFYLSQIFFPLTERFSIVHDVAISKSIISPWTTLPSLLGIFGLLLSALLRARSNFFYSFAMLFFFINHIVESTVFPLELIFEHRNYVPSMFLFLPLVSLWKRCIDRTSLTKPHRAKLILLLGYMIFFLIIFTTFTRNMDWRSEFSLWDDALIKTPNNFRANYYMAVQLNNAGKTDEALALYERANTLSDRAPNPIFAQSSSLDGIGVIYLHKGDYNKAITYFSNAIDISYDYLPPHVHRAEAYLEAGMWDAASREADVLLRSNSRNAHYNYLKGVSLLQMSWAQEAYEFMKRANDISQDEPTYQLGMVMVLKSLKKYKEALVFLKKRRAVLRFGNGDVTLKEKVLLQLALLELSILTDDLPGIESIKRDIIDNFEMNELEKIVQSQKLPYFEAVLFNQEVVRPYLLQR